MHHTNPKRWHIKLYFTYEFNLSMRKRKKEIALPEYTEKFLQRRNFFVFQMPNSHQTMNCNSSLHIYHCSFSSFRSLLFPVWVYRAVSRNLWYKLTLLVVSVKSTYLFSSQYVMQCNFLCFTSSTPTHTATVYSNSPLSFSYTF